jgi:hypothetical protein
MISWLYELGVAGYIVKADPAKPFLEATTLLDTYWKKVEFPPVSVR